MSTALLMAGVAVIICAVIRLRNAAKRFAPRRRTATTHA